MSAVKAGPRHRITATPQTAFLAAFIFVTVSCAVVVLLGRSAGSTASLDACVLSCAVLFACVLAQRLTNAASALIRLVMCAACGATTALFMSTLYGHLMWMLLR